MSKTIKEPQEEPEIEKVQQIGEISEHVKTNFVNSLTQVLTITVTPHMTVWQTNHWLPPAVQDERLIDSV